MPPPIPQFDDVSAAAGLKTANLTSFGLQWADYDNDGYMDFYVGRHGGCDPDLFRSNGNGQFSDVSLTSGIRDCGNDRHNCVWGDLNEDRRIDLFCASQTTDGALINQGNGTFVDQGAALGFGIDSGRAASLLDWDNDGDLDIVYGAHSKLGLYRNNNNASSFSYTDLNITTRNQGPRSQSVADYDGDDIDDVFMGMYQHTTWLLMKGTGSGFVDTTSQAGLLAGGRNGAQAGTWADYDNDGDLDLFITDWRNNVTNRPHALMENLGNGTFANVTNAAQIPQASARVGLWGDFNNDGWLDLFIVNGMTNGDGVNRPDQLYLNNGNKAFSLAAGAGLDGPSQGSGDSAAWADYDRDGDLDILVGNGSGQLECSPDDVPNCLGPDKLYRNRGNSNNSFQVRLISSTDTYGYRAKVWLDTPAGTQYREMTDGMVGKSQNAQVLHFGLGSYSQVTQLRIRWPNGQQETYTSLAANTSPIVIQQGSGVVPPPTPAPTPSALPNLIEKSVAPPPVSIVMGQSFQTADSAENVGSVQAAASTTRYYLSTDRTKNAGDILLGGGRSIPPLAAGAHLWGTAQLIVPSSTPTGNYYVLACADGDGVVVETAETDNCKPSGSTMQVRLV